MIKQQGQYSKSFKTQQRNNKLFILASVWSLIFNLLIYFMCIFLKDFLFGNYLAELITIVNVSAFAIKFLVFDRAIS